MSNSVHSFLFTQETRLNNYINQLLQQSTRAFSITSSVARQNKFNRENNKEHTISNLKNCDSFNQIGFSNPPPSSHTGCPPASSWFHHFYLFIYLCLPCIFFFKIECLLAPHLFWTSAYMFINRTLVIHFSLILIFLHRSSPKRGNTFLYINCYNSSMYRRLLYFVHLNPESPP